MHTSCCEKSTMQRLRMSVSFLPQLSGNTVVENQFIQIRKYIVIPKQRVIPFSFCDITLSNHDLLFLLCLPLLSILPPISKHHELVLANGKHLCGFRKAFAAMTACFTMNLCQHTAVISSTPWVFVCACVWSCGGRGSFDEMPWVKRLAELSGMCPSEDAARAPISLLASHSLGEARF